MKTLLAIFLSLFVLFMVDRVVWSATLTTTANISRRDSLWNETTPKEQVVLSIGDMFFLSAISTLDDPEFRHAAQGYHEQFRRSEKAHMTYKKAFEKHDSAVGTYERTWNTELSKTILAQEELERLAIERGASRLRFSFLRYLGFGIFAVDLSSRVYYLYFSKKDPGLFPFSHAFLWLATDHLGDIQFNAVH